MSHMATEKCKLMKGSIGSLLSGLHNVSFDRPEQPDDSRLVCGTDLLPDSTLERVHQLCRVTSGVNGALNQCPVVLNRSKMGAVWGFALRGINLMPRF